MNELLKKMPGEKTIGLMAEERIFVILENHKKDLFLVEACDEYFGLKLNTEICKDISDYFGELAKRLQGVDENE